MIVYFHRNPITFEIFYVGIASENGRCQRPHKLDNRNRYWTNTVKKYGGFIVQIVHNGLLKERACCWERFYIRLLGRKIDGGQLVNLALGGETNAGYSHTKNQREASRQRMIQRGTGHMMTADARAKAISKISESLKGKMTGSKNPNFGKRWTEEMRLIASDKKKAFYAKRPKNKKIRIKLDPIIARNNIYNGMVDAWGKKVLCTKTGATYKTIVEAANSIGMKKDTLRHKLNGKRPNETSFVFLAAKTSGST